MDKAEEEKTMLKRRFFFFLFCISIMTSSLALTLKVGIYDNPPISYMSSGKAEGILVDVIDYVAKKEGWHLIYVYKPLNVLINELKTKKIDLVLGVVENKDLKKFCDFTDGYFFSDWGQVYEPFGSRVLSFFDLEGKRIGVVRNDPFYVGIHGIKYLLDHLEVHAKFVEFSSYIDAFHAAENHTVDVVVANRFFGSANAARYNMEMTPIIFSPVEERIAFSKTRSAKEAKRALDGYLPKLKEEKNSVLNLALKRYLSQKNVRFVLPMWIVYTFYIVAGIILLLLINVAILRKLVKRKTKEIEMKNRALNQKNEELTASNEEINAMNEELENAYAVLEELSSRFQAMVVILSQFDVTKMNEREFLKHVLDTALHMMPHAEYGHVSIFEHGKWKLVASQGNIPNFVQTCEVQKTALVKKNGTGLVKETLVAPLRLSDEFFGCLEVSVPNKSDFSFSQGEIEIFDSFAKIATAFYASRRYIRHQREMHERLIMVLVKALEKYDKYTKGHSARVAECSQYLAKKMGLGEEAARRIYQAGLLHDIGKIFIPLSILNKNGSLTSKEYEEIKKHPTIGAELIEEGAKLTKIALIVRHHHEMWNGKGYPSGLKGEEIPLESRIMSVCDAYDSMVSDRPYRKALDAELALKEIEKNVGVQFDPKIAKLFVEIKKNKEI